jgi:UDP-2-acetamido-3-amino-2,3-dideoxy-glucuronate N-acetyltransferase
MNEGLAICDLAQKNSLILMVDHLMNHHPAIVRIKEMVAAGEFGQICHIFSRRQNFGKIRREENALWSLAPHDISLIVNILKQRPLSISAFGGSYLTAGVEDLAEADLIFPFGVTAHISVSWLNPFNEKRLVVVGLDKMAVFDDSLPWSDKLVVYPHKVAWKGLEPETRKANPEKVTLPEEEPLKRLCLSFLGAIESRIQPPECGGQEAMLVLSILTAMDRSLAEKTPQNLSSFLDNPPFYSHPTAIIDPEVIVGSGSKIWHFSHILKGSVLGSDCNIGQNVVIGPKVKIGQGCKIQNNVSVYEGVELEENVFCGPSMVFTNVNNPRAFIRRMHEARPTLLKKGCSVGANATIVCGHILGEYCFVAAGSVVTSDVLAHALMMGVPARQHGWVCRCGEKLSQDLKCQACGLTYSQSAKGLVVKSV